MFFNLFIVLFSLTKIRHVYQNPLDFCVFKILKENKYDTIFFLKIAGKKKLWDKST